MNSRATRNKKWLLFFAAACACAASACGTGELALPEEEPPPILEQNTPAPLVRHLDLPFVDLEPHSSSADQPAWLQEPVHITAAALPLGMLLRHALEQLPGSLRPTLVLAPDAPRHQTLDLHFQGSLEELLKAVAALSGCAWSASGTILHWQRQITRLFDLAALPGSTNFRLGGQGSLATAASTTAQQGDAGSEDGEQHIRIQGKHQLWRGLEDTLQRILGTEGHVSVHEADTSVTVTGPAPRVEEVERYIRRLNHSLSRQVRIDIKVLQVSLNREHASGIDWSIIRNKTNYRARLSGSLLTQLANNSSLPVLQFSRTASSLEGSQILIKALSEQGEVAVETAPQAVLLNNHPAEIRLANQTSYLASTTAGGVTNDGVTQAGLNPGVVSDGVSFYLLPKIMQERVYLQLAINISTLQPIQSVASGGQEIQVPVLNENRFILRHMVHNGATLVIGGIREQRRSRSRNKPFGLDFLGARERRLTNSETVILITPTLL